MLDKGTRQLDIDNTQPTGESVVPAPTTKPGQILYELKGATLRNEVMLFFGENGIEFDEVPKVAYAGRKPSTEKGKPSTKKGNPFVDTHFSVASSVIGTIGMLRTRALYGDLFGLGLSDTAASEPSNTYKPVVDELVANNAREVHIFAGDGASEKRYLEAMAGSLWKILEVQNGVYDPGSFIEVGISEFAGRAMIGENVDALESISENPDAILYEDTVRIIASEIAEHGYTLSDFLKPEVRKKIEKVLIEKLAVPYQKALARELKKNFSKKPYQELIQKDPAYESFRKNPCEKTLLEALRNRGLSLIADEIAGQDMSKILEFTKSCI